MLKKPKWIKPSSVKSYDDAIHFLRMIKEGKRRAEKSTYEAIYTQLFQKVIRSQGDCVLRNVDKSWKCNGEITAGHVFSRSVKQYKWDTRNCYPQCKSCNQMHQFYPSVYQDWLKEKIGVEEYEKMKEIVRMRPFYDIPYDEVISQIDLCLSLIQRDKSG